VQPDPPGAADVPRRARLDRSAFAAPGDFVQLDVRETLCDATSAGFTAVLDDHVVMLVFSPLANGPRRAVVLTTSPCAGLTSELATCGSFAKGGVSCVQVNEPGDPVTLNVVGRPAESPRL
jgi:hypothetical protein